MTAKTERAERAYRLLRENARNKKDFTIEEFGKAIGWEPATVATYVTKHWRDLVARRGDRFHVKPEFLRLGLDEFLKHMSQKRLYYAEYKRRKYEQFLMYEFLLPLTREDKLRGSLDNLFYRDTVQRRLDEVGLKKLQKVIPLEVGESEAEYRDRLSDECSRIGGYSISHVSGRFRAAELITRAEAGKLLTDDGKYLIDETTAVVRFIIPLDSGASEYGGDFESTANALEQDGPCDANELRAELTKYRVLFFQLFVEEVVRTVQGEDEIWLVETGPSRRLYILSRPR